MKSFQQASLLGLLLGNALAFPSQAATMANRWSFDTDTIDSVGGNTGVLQGDASVADGQLILTGVGTGPDATRMTFTNPVDIGVNFGGVDDEGVTIETWYTDAGTGNWGKLFHFGENQAGIELAYTHTRADVILSGVDRDGAKVFDERVTQNEEHHLVITVTVDGTMNAWVDGVKKVNNSDTNDLANVTNTFEALGATSWPDPGMTGSINEFRIWDGTLTDFEVSQNLASGPDLVPTAEDSDGDGLPDAWELAQTGITALNELNGTLVGPGPGAGSGDFDNDDLTDLEEYTEGTDAGKEDSDDDGLPDGAEVNDTLTDPLDSDTDDDGLLDGAEVNTHGSSPLFKDTDMDFIDDAQEVANGTDPADANDPGPFTGVELAHRWSFTTGAQQLVDSVGGNDAVTFGSPEFMDNQIVFDGLGVGADADSFGFTDLINIGPNFGASGVSFESWYTDTGTGTWAKLLAFGNGQQGANAIFNLQRGNNNVTSVQVNGVDFSNETRPPLNVEHHLALTITPEGEVNAWIDGVHMNSANNSDPLGDGDNLVNTGNTFERVGASAWNDASMTGSVNEFRIWKGSLTPENVAENFSNGPDLLVGEGSLAISALSRNSENGTVTLTFNSIAGRTYQIDRSPDLLPADSPNWVDVEDTFLATSNVSTFTDNTASGERLFYRVQDVTNQ